MDEAVAYYYQFDTTYFFAMATGASMYVALRLAGPLFEPKAVTSAETAKVASAETAKVANADCGRLHGNLLGSAAAFYVALNLPVSQSYLARD